MSLVFRWLGVAGVELKVGEQVLVLDPFFTRPSLFQLLHQIRSDSSSVADKLPICSFVLVTHAHYDHLLDVPSVLRQTGAVAYGSANTCQLLHALGMPESQARQVKVGDQLSRGAFQVDVIEGQHSPIPFSSLFNGSLRPGSIPPRRVTDYRMDICLGYCIRVSGISLLICAARPQPADVLFAGAQETSDYYLDLFEGVRPQTFIPIHWDNFTRPLSKPVRRFARPGRLKLQQLTHLAHQVLPSVNVIVPEIFREYTL